MLGKQTLNPSRNRTHKPLWTALGPASVRTLPSTPLPLDRRLDPRRGCNRTLMATRPKTSPTRSYNKILCKR